MRISHLTVIISSLLLLAACGAESQPPVLTFVGTASGTIETPTDALVFSDRFPDDLRSIVGVAAFETAPDGTEVMASWFMPDERRPPFGRRNLTVESGALVARFTLATVGAWEPGPYLLQIHARMPTKEGEPPLTASGSVQFFVGMTEEEIEAYREEYAAWGKERREQTAAREAAETEAETGTGTVREANEEMPEEI